MKFFVRCFSVAAVLALLAVSCGKEDDSGASLTFDVPSVYFSAAGAQAVVTFTAKEVGDFYIASKPTGWGDDNVILDADRRQVTIVMPEATEDGTVVTSGAIMLNGYTSKKNLKSATLFVGIVPEKQLTAPANCFIVTEKETNYSFRPVRRDGTELHPASVGLIWQTSSKLLQYLYFDATNNRISFYVGADATHTDEILRGNALIGAYDAEGTLLWSWHIWSCSYDPEEDGVAWQNGFTMMGRNLGALDHANSTTAERLASYGLYYQWGRKEPFVGPADYKFSNGVTASMYAADYATAKYLYVEADAETGTDAYARQHPLTFLTGTPDNGCDWRWNGASVGSWSDSDDPCPAGWHVAPASAFTGLLLEGEPTAEDYDVYGWPLTDGTSTSLFLAGGRRTYLNGYFQNVYQPEMNSRANTADEAQPWVGIYWSREAASGSRDAYGFHFWYDKKNVTGGTAAFVPYGRANALSVRCVKE